MKIPGTARSYRDSYTDPFPHPQQAQVSSESIGLRLLGFGLASMGDYGFSQGEQGPVYEKASGFKLITPSFSSCCLCFGLQESEQ